MSFLKIRSRGGRVGGGGVLEAAAAQRPLEHFGAQFAVQRPAVGVEDRIGRRLAGGAAAVAQVRQDDVEQRQRYEDETELDLDGQRHQDGPQQQLQQRQSVRQGRLFWNVFRSATMNSQTKRRKKYRFSPNLGFETTLRRVRRVRRVRLEVAAEGGGAADFRATRPRPPLPRPIPLRRDGLPVAGRHRQPWVAPGPLKYVGAK